MPKHSEAKKKEAAAIKAKVAEMKPHFPNGFAKTVVKNLGMEDNEKSEKRVYEVSIGRSSNIEIAVELVRLAKIEIKKKEDLFK